MGILKQPLITVIVPVYNVEKYVKKCVDSILDQDYFNLEIMLIDDGSTDHSGAICDELSKVDPRIIVIHKENGGLSDARNTAIDAMHGDYVTYIDSDDYIEKNYISYLYYLIEKYNVELSICNFKYVNEKGILLNKVIDDGKERVLNQKDAVSLLLEGNEINTSASMKLYRASLFDNIRYPLGKLYEDISVTYKILLNTQKVAYGERSLYVYLCRNGSITKRSFSEKRMDAIYNMQEMCNDIASVFPELKKKCESRMFSQYVKTYMDLRGSRWNKGLEYQLFSRIVNLGNNRYLHGKMKIYSKLACTQKFIFDMLIDIENWVQNLRK
ncbi:glycosyltransferase family 2 protein [Butyrivibrio sp. NC2002]|uniref:glycosyltransferase family 2 protein n=1 Tax=Butyrivibrio sp. NC2002 TaxID=1410610 RepID=UPI00068BC2EC|nr:glycosyltransferase [Butyrivibrio sp. NC2002]